MMAVDKIVNFQIDKFTHQLVESISHKKLRITVLRCLKRRGERKEAAFEVAQALDNIAGGHRKDYHYSKTWTINHKTVVYDEATHKFRLKGEWMLPLQTLDKLGSMVPSVAKKLANPEIWKK
jgi:hypothetical protein